jgi:hypothetical protein
LKRALRNAPLTQSVRRQEERCDGRKALREVRAVSLKEGKHVKVCIYSVELTSYGARSWLRDSNIAWRN